MWRARPRGLRACGVRPVGAHEAGGRPVLRFWVEGCWKNRACRRAEEMERSGSSEAVEGDNARAVGWAWVAGAEGSRNTRKSPEGFGAFRINVLKPVLLWMKTRKL